MANQYDDNSIIALKGAERVRQRPAVMFGSADITGAFHTFIEIVGNALDEARAGYGKQIDVVYHSDGSLSVRDYGRGVPMGWNEKEQRYNWDLVFNDLYAGGKYNDDGNYNFSVGLNGLGAASTQYTSKWFNVVSYTKDTIYTKKFERGKPTDNEPAQAVANDTNTTGTYIHWQIDNDVFPDTEFKKEMFIEFLEPQAHIANITINFVDEVHDYKAQYVGTTLQDYLEQMLGGGIKQSFVLHNKSQGKEQVPGKAQAQDYRAECEIVLSITESREPIRKYFHNTAVMRNANGYHHQAFDSALADFFKDIGKTVGLKIQPRDYEDYISCLISTYSNITSFYNQTKDGVSSSFIFFLIKETMLDCLELEYAKGNEALTGFVNSVVASAQARVRAKELEKIEKTAVQQQRQAVKVKPEKFKDCSSNKPAECELYIVEGDSALGSCLLARDSRFQALIPVQGKILNCLKAGIDRIVKSEIINNLVAVIGTGVDLGTKNMFDIRKLKFDKIVICTDADVDGFQIRVLLYCMFYRLMPELLKQGKVYIVETPLFEIETSRGTDFVYTVEEKDKKLKEYEQTGVTVRNINRSKGLGENTPEMMRKTTMLPETRKLIQLKIDVQEQIVRELSQVLFGNDYTNQRKEFVKELLGVQLSDLVDEIETLTEDDRNMEDNDEETEESQSA